jgi:Methyltransferase domain
MHEAAMTWVARHVPMDPLASVLDLGGRDINGSVRPLFPKATKYTVVDINPGEGVDVVADAATWEPDDWYDVVVAAEVFEHTWVWPEICRTAFWALRSGGLFIATMGGPGRQPHSGIDGKFRLLPGDYYANVSPHDLEQVLKDQGWVDVTVDQTGLDTRSVATKP